MHHDDDVARLRKPPHSAEAEQGVLGALLLDNQAFERVADLLRPEDFYFQDHRAIYATVCALVAANKPADVITVYEAGGHDVSLLNALQQSLPSASNARRYAEIVRERALERRLITVADAAVTHAYEGRASVELMVDAVVTQLLQLVQAQASEEPRDLAAVLPEWIDALSEQAEGGTPAMATGLIDLDRITGGGIWPGELWVIGARPSMGKSALSLTLARRMAERYSVAFLSQEDSLRTLVSRMVASAGRVNLADIRSPQSVSNADALWSGVSEGVERLTKLQLRVDDQAGLTLLDVRRKAQQVKRRYGKLHVLLVDYLQLMVGEAETRNRELGDIANGLKKLAKDFGIGVVLLSQLTRKADDRTGPPQMSDLRESGDIEGAADLIGMLYREHMRKPTPENKHYAELHVCKNKNGITDTIPLHFDGAFQRFSSWEGPRPIGTKRGQGGGGGMS
jgi:replicative DNA helicase